MTNSFLWPRLVHAWFFSASQHGPAAAREHASPAVGNRAGLLQLAAAGDRVLYDLPPGTPRRSIGSRRGMRGMGRIVASLQPASTNSVAGSWSMALLNSCFSVPALGWGETSGGPASGLP